MSEKKKNLSVYNPDNIPDVRGIHVGIVVSEWNNDITDALLQGATDTLIKHGISQPDIKILHTPGSFELPLGAQFLANTGEFDAIICLGCVIQGDTRHFDFICQGVTHGIMDLNLKFNIPIIFGVLTTNTYEQARERAGGSYGNKGDEAAVTAIKMVDAYRTSHSVKRRNLTP